MQGTAIASGKTRIVYVQTIIIWQKVVNAEVGITAMLYFLS